MRFLNKEVGDFRECYEAERPYVFNPNKNDKEAYQIPSTLINLAQIVQYYTNSTFKKAGKLCVDVHNLTRIMVSKESSTWDNEIDKLFRIIEKIDEPLIINQLLPKTAFLKKAMFAEMDAIKDEKILLWRFSTRDWQEDKRTYGEDNEHISFGDSLLAGYIEDGMYYSNIASGLTNYSACPLSYYHIHTEAIAAKSKGYIEDVALNKLPPHYQEYIQTIPIHQVYTLNMSYSEIYSLSQQKYLKIPLTTESSAACFQKGEEFHPKLEPIIYEDTDALATIDSRVKQFYLGSEATTNSFSSSSSSSFPGNSSAATVDSSEILGMNSSIES